MTRHPFQRWIPIAVLAFAVCSYSVKADTPICKVSGFIVSLEKEQTVFLRVNSDPSPDWNSERSLVADVTRIIRQYLSASNKTEVVLYLDMFRIPCLQTDFMNAANAVRPFFANRSLARWNDEETIREFLNTTASKTTFFNEVKAQMHELGCNCVLRYDGEHPTLKTGIDRKWNDIENFPEVLLQPENRHYSLSCAIPQSVGCSTNCLSFDLATNLLHLCVARIDKLPFHASFHNSIEPGNPEGALEFNSMLAHTQFGAVIDTTNSYSRVVYIESPIWGYSVLDNIIWSEIDAGWTYTVVTAVSNNGEWLLGTSKSERSGSRTWLWHANKCALFELHMPMVYRCVIQFCSNDGNLFAGNAILKEGMRVPFVVDKTGIHFVEQVNNGDETISCLELIGMSENGERLFVNGFNEHNGYIGVELINRHLAKSNENQ